MNQKMPWAKLRILWGKQPIHRHRGKKELSGLDPNNCESSGPG